MCTRRWERAFLANFQVCAGTIYYHVEKGTTGVCTARWMREHQEDEQVKEKGTVGDGGRNGGGREKRTKELVISIHFRLQLRDRKSKRREIHWRARE